MINLLPHSAKKSIAKEYWVRVITVWLFLCTTVLLIVSALLIPTYVAIAGKIKAYAADAEAALAAVSDFKLSSATLVDANRKAQLLISNKDVPNYTNLIDKFNSLTNSGITITNLTLAIDADTLKPITLSGTATTRESLATFRETLLNEPDIDTVFLPISNLAQDRDISFTITVTMKPTS